MADLRAPSLLITVASPWKFGWIALVVEGYPYLWMLGIGHLISTEYGVQSLFPIATLMYCPTARYRLQLGGYRGMLSGDSLVPVV